MTAGNKIRDLALADLNGDGDPDLVYASGGRPNQVVVRLNRGDGTFRQNVDYDLGDPPSAALALAAADFDGDGSVDLAVGKRRNLGTGKVAVLLNNGAGGLGEAFEYGTRQCCWSPSGHRSATAADFDGDGDVDVATSGWLLLNEGDGTFVEEVVGYVLGESLTAVDLDGDGDLDLASLDLSTRSDGTVSVALSQCVE